MNTEDEKTRGTTSVYRSLTKAAFESVYQHSVLLREHPLQPTWSTPFGALLAGGIQSELTAVSHLPTALLRRPSDLLVPVQTHLLMLTLYHFKAIKSIAFFKNLSQFFNIVNSQSKFHSGSYFGNSRVF